MNQSSQSSSTQSGKYSIGFIGAGNMANSLINGLLATGFAAEDLWAADPDCTQLARLSGQQGIHTTSDNNVLVSHADVIVLAVKPQVIADVVRPLHEAIRERKALVISIAAGITATTLNRWLPDVAVIRCMPNTPALVGKGMTGLFATVQVSDQQKQSAEMIMRAVGETVWLDDETLIDSVTAVSGSGPAYFFLMMEAMEDAAIKLGLSERTARLLVQQTALGAATMVAETGEAPAQLRRNVTSPGGTTEKALGIFEQHHYQSLIAEALQGARDRSVELSEIIGKS
ncbi:MAG TPA: pyrroline-5-carboxylate reductase [Crenotrichaceae bacterium]|nr:pyrroline-5-carboxylate reductase [Crenotrichaceae bacterium]